MHQSSSNQPPFIQPFLHLPKVMEEGQGLTVSWEGKLKEFLHGITSVEIKLCRPAVAKFVWALEGDHGGELLRQYVRASPGCSELLAAWKLWQGKEGLSDIFHLIAAILSHDGGKYNKSNTWEIMAIARRLDKFARSLVAAKYLGDVYKELSSRDDSRQRAALLLMASIVGRGPSLASEVLKCFDLRHPAFTMLSERNWSTHALTSENSFRNSYVGFAMSFLEVGRPGLLRWVLQQKEIYAGVLGWLGYDDNETQIHVLSTFRDRLLEEALIPPGLRSVLFGTKALEQLIFISAYGVNRGRTAELAYNLLVLVCFHRCNGLMPDLKKGPIPLRGITERFMGIMTKLCPAEIQYHRDLLLAIVNGQPSFGLSYLEEFPYDIKDYMSPSWLSAVTLVVSLVSLIGNGLSKEFFNSRSDDLRVLGNIGVQNVMKCMVPRPFSRSMIKKGLLHSDILVKHGTLRLLLELLKLLESFISALNRRSSSTCQSIKQEIQNDVQALLPDPQVLLTLLSSCLERTGSPLNHRSRRNKMLKMDAAEREAEVYDEDVIGGLKEIWGVEMCSMMITSPKEVEIYLHSKLHKAFNYFQVLIVF